MNMLYEKYKNLKIDGSWIGLELGGGMPCFAHLLELKLLVGIMAYTTALLKVLEIWFSALIQKLVAITLSIPLPVIFCDFLGLILATGGTNTLQQIIWWDKKMFDDFVNCPEEQEYKARPEVKSVLDTIRKGMDVALIDTPFEYIKDLQSKFPYEQISFTNEYYDILGIECPNGTVPED